MLRNMPKWSKDWVTCRATTRFPNFTCRRVLHRKADETNMCVWRSDRSKRDCCTGEAKEK